MPKQATPFLCPACKAGQHPFVERRSICQCGDKSCACFAAQVRAGVRGKDGS